MLLKKSLLILCILASWSLNAQMTQTLRGKIIDKESKQPLVGVNAVIKDSNPIRGTTTNSNGEFEIKNLTLGKHTLLISYLGYKPAMLRDLLVKSGKQTVVNIELEEQAITTEEIVITAYRKGETQNKMATVSARSFSVAETERYAGSLGDPARMAANYAGVARAGDDRNDIIIRGNSPTGLQWRLEGMNIPNPNHWGAAGTTGGPVSILNNNTLSNSDFFTGAFPAEYGNALSGVFDLKMRSGNNRKHEFTGQIGFGGFEVMTEGPFSKNYNGSYMVTGRYSVLDAVDKIGINVAGGAVPEYYDITFKFDLPTKKLGNFEIFGVAGRSYIELIADEMNEGEKYNTLDQSDTYNGSDLTLFGLSHQIFLSEKSYLYTTAMVAETKVKTTVDSVWYENNNYDNKLSKLIYGEINSELITSVGAKYVNKINSKNTFTLGLSAEIHNIAYQDSFLNRDRVIPFYQPTTDTKENGLTLLQAYTQWQHKFNNKTTLNTGIFTQQFTFNNSFAIEPRIGLAYEPFTKHRISLAYGMHSRAPAMFYYFIETYDERNNTLFQTNNELEFLKAHHLVLAYDYSINENLRLKTEVYYQDLYNIPINDYSSNYSILNQGAEFHLWRTDSLVNKGKGKNYGLEFTIEKYLNNNWYFLLTGSIFDSYYTPSDNIVRHTAFAANYATNTLAGYELKLNESFAIDFNAKVTWSGGKRNNYIDIDESIRQNKTVYNDEKAYSVREKDYFVLDFRISLKNNSKKYSQEWALDISNLTNNKNIYSKNFNSDNNSIEYIYQQGIFPMFLYRINF